VPKNAGALEQPFEFEVFLEQSPILPGEDFKDYEFIKQMTIDDVSPQTNTEWLWTLDLVEPSWEILRYRRLKQKVLDIYREDAIQSILSRPLDLRKAMIWRIQSYYNSLLFSKTTPRLAFDAPRGRMRKEAAGYYDI
jgi:hypothetical protein